MLAVPFLSPAIRRALDALPDPYLVLAPDAHFTVLTANDAYLKALGTTRAALRGQTLFDVLPPAKNLLAADWDSLRASLEQVVRTGQSQPQQVQRLDLPTRGNETKETYWEIRNTPVLDARGAVHYILHQARDVTIDVQAHARTQALLETQDRHLLQLLQQVPAAVAALQGPEHCYTFLNPGYQKLTGNRVVLGQRVADALPELAAQGFITLLDEVYRTGQTYYGQQTQLRLHGPGPARELVVDFTYQALRDHQQVITGILVFAVEVAAQEPPRP